MQTESTSAVFNRQVLAPAMEGDAGGGRGARAGRWWRSHTFMDGTREIVLHVRLGPVVAGALHARLCEMTAHGCDRVVLDLRASGPLGIEELGLLAGALAGQPPDCRIALLVPDHVDAGDMLGEHVRVVRTLSSARRMLEPASRDRVPGAAGPLVPPDWHELAVRQSLRWASLAAAEGDYEQALTWLSTVETAQGSLPAEWRRRQQAWMRARHRPEPTRPALRRSRGRQASGP